MIKSMKSEQVNKIGQTKRCNSEVSWCRAGDEQKRTAGTQRSLIRWSQKVIFIAHLNYLMFLSMEATFY